MGYHDGSLVAWAIAAIQAMGLVSAFCARASVGSRGQSWCQAVCLACLALVGLSSLIAAISSYPLIWLASSANFGVMVMAAIWDLSPKEARAA